MTEALLSLLVLLGVPAALVTLIVLAALTVTRRRTTQPPGRPDDPAARQAWAAAYTAHVRLARLEARVRDLERHARHSTAATGEWP
jgi:hypothetical protein